ncbi:MAG: hypothetical protein V1826_00040 [bacterium]
MTEDLAKAIANAGITKVEVRSVIGCRANWGVCQKCYGRDLATGELVAMGEAVGIVAAQSIGEPGTQLTMRTFHTGGVASTADITQGLPRVEELFEARRPKTPAVISPGDGTVSIMEVGNKKLLRLEVKEDAISTFETAVGDTIKAKDGDKVKKGDTLYVNSAGEEVDAPAGGDVQVTADGVVKLAHIRKGVYEYPITNWMFLRVQDGGTVEKGQQLTEGQLDPHELMRLKGHDATQAYIISEVQNIYGLQGQNINDKHIEAVVRQMFSKVRIESEGNSEWLAGDIIERLRFEREAASLVAKGKTPPTGTLLLLGISKAALNTESFLSAASFQETTRVLVDAAVSGKVDYLRGLKENVIVGRLIPAGTGFASRQNRPGNNPFAPPIEKKVVPEANIDLAGDDQIDSKG